MSACTHKDPWWYDDRGNHGCTGCNLVHDWPHLPGDREADCAEQEVVTYRSAMYPHSHPAHLCSEMCSESPPIPAVAELLHWETWEGDFACPEARGWQPPGTVITGTTDAKAVTCPACQLAARALGPVRCGRLAAHGPHPWPPARPYLDCPGMGKVPVLPADLAFSAETFTITGDEPELVDLGNGYQRTALPGDTVRRPASQDPDVSAALIKWPADKIELLAGDLLPIRMTDGWVPLTPHPWAPPDGPIWLNVGATEGGITFEPPPRAGTYDVFLTEPGPGGRPGFRTITVPVDPATAETARRNLMHALGMPVRDPGPMFLEPADWLDQNPFGHAPIGAIERGRLEAAWYAGRAAAWVGMQMTHETVPVPLIRRAWWRIRYHWALLCGRARFRYDQLAWWH